MLGKLPGVVVVLATWIAFAMQLQVNTKYFANKANCLARAKIIVPVNSDFFSEYTRTNTFSVHCECLSSILGRFALCIPARHNCISLLTIVFANFYFHRNLGHLWECSFRVSDILVLKFKKINHRNTNNIFLCRYEASPKGQLMYLVKVLLNGEHISNFQKCFDEFSGALSAKNLVIDR